MSANFYLDITKIVYGTDDALLVTTEQKEGEETWIPKSQIRNFDEINPEVGDEDLTFEIPHWLAREKGFNS